MVNRAEAESLLYHSLVEKGVIESGVCDGGTETMQLTQDLLEWYNSTGFDIEDLQRLRDLALERKFRAWDCDNCGARVYEGMPDDWSHFQGVLQIDLVSYPGNGENAGWCDHCRCYHGSPLDAAD